MLLKWIGKQKTKQQKNEIYYVFIYVSYFRKFVDYKQQ